MSKSAFEYLEQHGLANVHAPDLSQLTARNQDLKAMYCSSDSCARNNASAKGKLVHVGPHWYEHCPKCRSNQFLYFDIISKRKADRFLQGN